jgi:enamine deaminase RidA (YjgF/YER057c/UK114 family)
MDRRIMSGAGLPKQIGPHSQAVRAGGFVFVSGQPGIDPQTKSDSTTIGTAAFRGTERG